MIPEEQPDFRAVDHQPLVAISILNWNGWRDTLECLESVRRLDYPNYLAIVVDNGSWDDSTERIKGWAHDNLGAGYVLADYTQEVALQGGGRQTEEALESVPSPARLVLIRDEENLGFTGGNNVAIHYALTRRSQADYVFLLNNDVTLGEECLTLLVTTDRRTGAGIVGPVVLSEDGRRIQFAKGGSPLRLFFAPIVKAYVPMPEGEEPLWESPFVDGAAMLASKDVLEANHSPVRCYLDERLFFAWEEVAFCNAAWKKGFKCIVAGGASVRHKVGQSCGGYVGPIHYYYSGRNRILVVSEFLSPAWRVLFHLVHTPMRLLSAAKNVSAGRLRSARAILWGLLDGYRGVTGKWRDHDCETNRGRRGGFLKTGSEEAD